MRIGQLAWIGLIAAVGCVSVPPEESPPISARKATASVDSSGRTIEGGNLVIEIPPGALDESERITVTIDAVRGAPGRHLSEAYLVSPEGQTFNLPVVITYKYRNAYIANVADRNALFLGVAVGSSWQPLDSQLHDQTAQRISGEVLHFSTFGLVDPNAPLDGGVILDASGLDLFGRDAAGRDAAGRDRTGVDAIRIDGSAPGNEIQVRLTWTGANSDFDLHFLRTDGAEFGNTDDCNYANCPPLVAGVPALDWPPTGTRGGDPLMDVDDLNGYGPENVMLAEPSNETYVVGVHLYNLNQDTLPIDYTVTVFWRSAQILSVDRTATRCGDYVDVASIAVSGNGTSVIPSQRSDSPVASGRGVCTFRDQ